MTIARRFDALLFYVKVIVLAILEIIGLAQQLLPLLSHPVLPGGV